MFIRWGAIALAIAVAGCMSAQQHRDAVRDNSGEALTVAKAQHDIKPGMSGGQVVTALGSPNIISTDENGNEVWIWDRISTERVYSNSDGGITLFGIGAGAGAAVAALGGGSASANASAGASSTSQRTLTIIVNFDKENKVRDVAYHTSRF